MARSKKLGATCAELGVLGLNPPPANLAMSDRRFHEEFLGKVGLMRDCVRVMFRSSTVLLLKTVCAMLMTTTLVMASAGGASDASSLYKPNSARPLSQAERWKLDFDLANEAAMKDHSSVRFSPPGSFGRRAHWFETTAQWYKPADLLQLMIDFRKSAMRNNENAFNQMVELGMQGDIGAACMAAMFYRYHEKGLIARWKYSFERVTREALKHKDSGHPVCFGLEGALYLYGELGYPKNRQLAKPDMLRSAVAGSFGNQEFMANMHHFESLRFEPQHVALKLCWMRVASRQSPAAFFTERCEGYRLGIAFDENQKEVSMPADIQQLGRQWCAPEKEVTANTCADLEKQLDTGAK